METLIHCQHCQEDTNSADWEANHGVCPHCGMETEPDWGLFGAGRRRVEPLARARRRLQLQPLLRSRPVHAY